MNGRAVRLLRSLAADGPIPLALAARTKRRGAKQKLKEFSGLARYLRGREIATVVEIGTLRGGTLWAWCQLASSKALIISVDLPSGPFGGGYAPDFESRLRSYSRPGQSLHLLRVDSHLPSTRDQVRQILGGRGIDLLFIDGDHTYAGARRDFELYAPLVAADGCTVLHDVLPHSSDPQCEVDRLWSELREAHPLAVTEISDRNDRKTGGQWGGIGVLEHKRCGALADGG